MSRPTELDDLKAKRICDAVAAGNTRRCAAQAAGIGFSTLIQWRRRGLAGEEPYAAFAARLQKADAEAEERHVRNIETAASEGTWQASAWWLERRRRHSYRPPLRITEQPQEQDLTQATDEQLLAAVKAEQQLRERKVAHG